MRIPRFFQRRAIRVGLVACIAPAALTAVAALAQGQNKNENVTSYSPVVVTEDFESIRKRLTGEKEKFERRQRELLERRYDLSDRPAKGVTMTRGKPIQEGVRVKLPKGVNGWDELSAMTPDEIRKKNLFPEGFLPLPHPKHEEGGMVFPQFHIDSVKKEEGR